MSRDVEAGLGGMWDKPRLLVWVANMLYALAAILMLYAVLFLLVHLPVFPLREIKVDGELKHVTREQVQLIVRRELKGNFFTLDLDQATLAGSSGCRAGRTRGAGAMGRYGIGEFAWRVVPCSFQRRAADVCRAGGYGERSYGALRNIQTVAGTAQVRAQAGRVVAAPCVAVAAE
jgi:hypothetical protein